MVCPARPPGSPARQAVPDAIDYLVAAGCFAAFTLPVLVGGSRGSGRPWPWPGSASWPRRRWPSGGDGRSRRSSPSPPSTWLATLVGVRFTPFVSNAGPDFAIAVFTAADRCDRRSSLIATIAAGLATWAVLPLGMHLHPGQDQDAVQATGRGPGVDRRRHGARPPRLPAAPGAGGSPPGCGDGGPRAGRGTPPAVPGRARRGVAQPERDRGAVGRGAAAAGRAARGSASRAGRHRDGQPFRTRRTAPAPPADPGPRGSGRDRRAGARRPPGARRRLRGGGLDLVTGAPGSRLLTARRWSCPPTASPRRR